MTPTQTCSAHTVRACGRTTLPCDVHARLRNASPQVRGRQLHGTERKVQDPGEQSRALWSQPGAAACHPTSRHTNASPPRPCVRWLRCYEQAARIPTLLNDVGSTSHEPLHARYAWQCCRPFSALPSEEGGRKKKW